MVDYEITPQDAQRLLCASEGEKPLLLDVREPGEFAIARITDSVLMPMGEVSRRAQQELDPEQPIFVLCHHGVRSMNVTVWLRGQGFEKAQSIAGGIDRWSRELDPSIPLY